ncbi:hypothetical protein GCM10025779_10210 [Arthrobacter cryoconiti]
MPSGGVTGPMSLPATTAAPDSSAQALSVAQAARQSSAQVLEELRSRPTGLAETEAANRLVSVGPNALRSHKANPWTVLGRQLRSPILILLMVTAALSLFLGAATNSIVIAVILLVSVGLGFSNEFRAERAAEALHSRVTHTVVVLRGGTACQIDVVKLVPGDVVQLSLGTIIPADIRLLSAVGLMCDESILTGESLPVAKDAAPISGDVSLGDLASCVFMGTVVQTGSCSGVVVATGARAEFGRIALGLGESSPQTEFQRGLK